MRQFSSRTEMPRISAAFDSPMARSASARKHSRSIRRAKLAYSRWAPLRFAWPRLAIVRSALLRIRVAEVRAVEERPEEVRPTEVRFTQVRSMWRSASRRSGSTARCFLQAFQASSAVPAALCWALSEGGRPLLGAMFHIPPLCESDTHLSRSPTRHARAWQRAARRRGLSAQPATGADRGGPPLSVAPSIIPSLSACQRYQRCDCPAAVEVSPCAGQAALG
jgi:hypothetical protein